MTEALVALGSNLGDRRSHMEHGLARLAALPETRLSAVSTLYETAPVGGPDNQGPYLNAVARVQTGLDARAFLAALHTIEAERERERVVRWAARTLDLDLLTHGDTVAEDGDLTVPHPRMHERRFVMVPVCDVAADMPHPRLQRPMSAILADLPVEPGDLTGLDSAWYTQILHPTE